MDDFLIFSWVIVLFVGIKRIKIKLKKKIKIVKPKKMH
jgi:hypothetical protein